MAEPSSHPINTGDGSIAIGDFRHIDGNVAGRGSVTIGSGFDYDEDYSVYYPYSGDYSVSIGSGAITNHEAIAIGIQAEAENYGVAIGAGSGDDTYFTKAFQSAVAVGSSTTAQAGSIAIGEGIAANMDGVSVGRYSGTDPRGTAIGYGAQARWKNIQATSSSTDTGSVAVGCGSTAKGIDYPSVAVGHDAKATGPGAIAIGHNAAINCTMNPTNKTFSAVAIGYNAQVSGIDGGIAVGRDSQAGVDSIAIGTSAVAPYAYYGVAIGCSANSNATGTIAIGYSAKTLTQTSYTNHYSVAIG